MHLVIYLTFTCESSCGEYLKGLREIRRKAAPSIAEATLYGLSVLNRALPFI